MKKVGTVILFIIAIAWFGHTFSKNFIVDPQFTKFLAHKDYLKLGEDWVWVLTLRIHILLALIALLSGPIAFLKKTRNGRKTIHRIVGKVYVLSVFINIFPALYVSFFATGGWISTTGFILLDLAWLITTYIAYQSIRNKNIGKHKKWMVRSYAVTLANTSIYIITLLLNSGIGIEYVASYQCAVWLGWILNLLIAQLIIKNLE
jgi:uncharacterized membrane protein